MSKTFKNTLKTFKSDITGEEKEYKVNNSIWLHMDELFNMNQTDFDKGILEGDNAVMAKFVTAAMKANNLDVSYEEVLENTDPESVIKFYNGFFDSAFLAEAKKKATTGESKKTIPTKKPKKTTVN